MRAVALALSLVTTAAAAQDGPIARVETSDGTVLVDRSGHGAVLCAWGIVEAVAAYGRVCRGASDAMQAELDDSLARIEAFIVANAARPPTADALLRSRPHAAPDAAEALCANADAGAMYDALAARGAAAHRAYVDDLLSVPREPVVNPCL